MEKGYYLKCKKELFITNDKYDITTHFKEGELYKIIDKSKNTITIDNNIGLPWVFYHKDIFIDETKHTPYITTYFYSKKELRNLKMKTIF